MRQRGRGRVDLHFISVCEFTLKSEQELSVRELLAGSSVLVFFPFLSRTCLLFYACQAHATVAIQMTIILFCNCQFTLFEIDQNHHDRFHSNVSLCVSAGR